MQKPVIVGITGASGSVLAFRLIGELLRLPMLGYEPQPVSLVLTQKSIPVIFEEMGLKLPASSDDRVAAILEAVGLPKGAEYQALLSIHDNNHLGAPPASGTHGTRGMVILPCSMGTLAKIAAGISDNLVCRAADVTMKEGRKLVIVPRESPLNQIHLKNMLTLSQCGVAIIPPVLTFYLPDFQSLEGQINYTVGKVLGQLGFEHQLHKAWGA